MKNVVRALICISISLIVLNCTNDETMPVQGKVQFALAITDTPSDGGRISSQSFPDGAYISLSIEKSSGTSVYALEKIDLIKLGDGYLTAPFELTEGSYRLTDFLVMSLGGEVLYATPKEGSPLAPMVADPLPMNFSITPDGIVNLNVQVVEADQKTSEDFGYVSFGVEVVGSDYAVSIFIADGNELGLASGKLELYQGNDLVYEQDLSAKINPVNFKGNPDATYKLVVVKEGYSIRTREYVLHELVDELGGKPLTFFLEQALTFICIPKSPSDPFSKFFLDLAVKNFDFVVDWGDGTVEHPTGYEGADGVLYANLGHHYEDNPNGTTRYINITGDVANITMVTFAYTLPIKIQKLDLTSLTALSVFRMVLTWDDGPEHIDFSGNSNLIGLELTLTKTKKIDVTDNHLLQFLDVTGTEISEENLNQIVSDLHRNALEHNFEGNFIFRLGYHAEQIPIKPLSEESKLKLIELRDHYNWGIYPNVQ